MMSTSKSEALFARALKVAPGGVHSPVRAFKGVGGTPRFIERADGAHLWDVDGNRYLDFCMSWGPLLFGHRDPEVAEAVQGALSRGWSFGACEPYSLELAELITGAIPWVEKVRFVNSGTEAVLSALRVARAATGRAKVLKFEGCYHGHVDSMLVKAGSGLAEMASPDSAGVAPHVAADTIAIPLDDDAALDAAFAKHGRELACAIVEPIPANHGLLPQREDFLRRLADHCRRAGALLIFDEVITGFRVGFQGYAGASGIHPDLVTYGKVIGGGFPVGAYGGKRELMNWVAPAGPVYQAGTLSANPVAMCAGLAMLKKLRRENPYAALEAKAERLAASMEKALSANGVAGAVQRASSLLWVVLGTPSPAPDGKPDGVVRAPHRAPEGQKPAFAKLFHALLARGVYLAPSGFEVSFLATAHTDALLAEAEAAFSAAVSEIARA